MPDRMTLLIQLEQLRSDAVQRGDDRALAVLTDAAEMLFADRRIDKVRQTDRRRKPKKTSSTESTDSTGIQRNPPEKTGGKIGFPTPLPKNEEEEKARAREQAQADPMYEINRGLLEVKMGDLFIDALRFVEERERAPVTWAGWYGEMLSILNGGKATAADVAQVCRDDSVLEAREEGEKRGVRTLHGLRVFVGNAVRERLYGGMGADRRPPFGANARGVSGVRRENMGGRVPDATELLIGE